MAKAAWKRPGSPIGKKGPRKANPKYKRRSRYPWTDKEVRQLRSLARASTPTGVISPKMQRPKGSIASKAHREGISLRPINRSPTTAGRRSRGANSWSAGSPRGPRSHRASQRLHQCRRSCCTRTSSLRHTGTHADPSSTANADGFRRPSPNRRRSDNWD